jgi:hypothetical protein
MCVCVLQNRVPRENFCDGRSFVEDRLLVAFILELRNGIRRRKFRNTFYSACFVCRIEFGRRPNVLALKSRLSL